MPVSFFALKKIVSRLKRKKKIIVFTNGCFDLLHAGHIQLLKKAKNKGDVLIVGLNSDRSARRLKGPGRPIVSQEDRALVLSSLRFVDYVVLFSAPTPIKLIRAISPAFLVKGADYKSSAVVGAGWVGSHGGKVVRVPLVKNRSSSGILKKLKDL